MAIVPAPVQHCLRSQPGRTLLLNQSSSTFGLKDTGAIIWAGARVLARLLECERCGLNPLPPPIHIIELGSGLGLPGLVAAATSGAFVTLTDVEDATQRLKSMVSHSGLAESEQQRVSVQPLDWTDPSCVEQLKWILSERPEERKILIGAEVLYDDAHPECLSDLIVGACGIPEVEVWLSNTPRLASHKFMRALKRHRDLSLLEI